MEKFNIVTSYIFTALCNILFVVSMVFRRATISYTLTLCALATVISIAVAYGKSKFGIYDSEKYQSNAHLVYCIQLLITFVVIFIVTAFMR